MKKLLFVLTAATIMGACGNKSKKCNESAMCEIKPITVDSFLTVAPNLIGKDVFVKGTVNQVCKESGKTMVLFTSCPSHAIKVVASDSVGQFDVALEGGDVCIKGMVEEKRVDIACIDSLEKKMKEEMANKACESKDSAEQGCTNKLAEYRKQIEASANGYISFYSIKVTSLNKCKTEMEKGCCHKTDSAKVCNDTNKVCNDTAKACHKEGKCKKGSCDGCKHDKKCDK